MTSTDRIAPLREFVAAMTRLVESTRGEEKLVTGTRSLLARLIAGDDWLPEEFARADPQTYRQFLLHCDPLERFSVVSFVWGPGQKTPVHDHTIWGLIGMLRGAETCRHYARGEDGKLRAVGEEHVLKPGDIDVVSPTQGDIHVVANAVADAPSVSIHVYGANIGAVRRHAYDENTGEAREFISGYSSTAVPNLWDRSAAA